MSLKDLHESLLHSGIVSLAHSIRSENLLSSVEDVRKIVSACPVCAELNPRFCEIMTGSLIKAKWPFECLNANIKRSLFSATCNKYRFTVTRMSPFALPCRYMTASAIIERSWPVFRFRNILIHPLKPWILMSEIFVALQRYCYQQNDSLQSNEEAECLKGTVYRCTSLWGLKGTFQSLNGKPLPDALHSVCSLLYTATKGNLHERLL